MTNTSANQMLSAFVVGIVVTILIFAAGLRLSNESVQKNSTPDNVHNIPCQEDEIVTVYRDEVPHHGLTWHCVNVEQFLNGERWL